MAIETRGSQISGGMLTTPANTQSPTPNTGCAGSIPVTSITHAQFAFAVLAQLVEHLTCNQVVTGSNPVDGSKKETNDVLVFRLVGLRE
jgi:hypothetical protein